jgi:hypothetical protein
MSTSYISQLIAIRLKLESPQPVKIQEGCNLLFQLWLENENNPDFISELDEIAEKYPMLMQELKTRYQIERDVFSYTDEIQAAEDKFNYDVFISYSHKDEDWVRSVLLPNLEKQNFKVCIDYRDFIAGKAAIINMQDASEASRHTLLVMTPRWVESEWTLYEGILSRTDDPAGLQRRTLPLLLEKCKPPKFISMLTWVDFTNKKHETEAWKNLFKSLDKEN